MTNFTVLQQIKFSFNKNKQNDILDVVKISENTFVFYDQKNIGVLQNFHLKNIFREILPNGEEITQVEHINKDLIVIGSKNRIIIFSIKTGKRVKQICFPELELECFLVLNKKDILVTHKQFIFKINITKEIKSLKEHLLLRTKLDQTICRIYKGNNDDILIQTFYENLHIYNLSTQQFTKYFYYDLPSRLLTNAVLLKNGFLLSYSKGNTCLNRMNIKNGSNHYIENNQLIHQMKKFDEDEQKYLISSFYNGKISLYEQKSQREVFTYFDKDMSNIKNAVYGLKNNKLLIVNAKCARLVDLEIVERNYCSFF